MNRPTDNNGEDDDTNPMKGLPLYGRLHSVLQNLRGGGDGSAGEGEDLFSEVLLCFDFCFRISEFSPPTQHKL